MKRQFKMLVLTIILTFFIGGCGSGGGSGDGGGGGNSTPPVSTLSGVAAVGYPIENGTINITCAGGSQLNTSTSSTGAWQVTISGQTLPCAVEVSGGTINGVANTIPYYSIATSEGTVNVTPLTDLMLANLVNTATPNTWFAGLTTAMLAPVTSTAVNTALTNQCNALSGLTQLCATNPITTVFTAASGNIMDDMLTALHMAMINTGVTYASLLSNASASAYTVPAGFNTALTNPSVPTSPISATANTTAQSLTVGTAMPSFSPLTPVGGTIPYTYSLNTGTLPAGLSFSTSTGAVTGTPTTTYASANLVFSVKDANNVAASTTSTVNFTVSTGGDTPPIVGGSTLTLSAPLTSISNLGVAKNTTGNGLTQLAWVDDTSGDLLTLMTDGGNISVTGRSGMMNMLTIAKDFSSSSWCVLDGTANPNSLPLCSIMGITFDRAAGIVTFASTPIFYRNALPPNQTGNVTMSGALSFTPF